VDPRREDEANLALVRALVHAIQGMRHCSSAVFSADGLTPGQFDTLGSLYHNGPLCVQDLLEMTVTTSGNIDVVLNNLIAKGLVTKTVDPADRRRRVVALTDKGRAHIEKRFPQYLRELRRQAGAISVPEKRALEGLLLQLGDGLSPDGLSPKGQPRDNGASGRRPYKE
jgi:MarR family transcriptional regulator, 2-MHQ and catechol-resistance regulon repressor